MAQTPFWATNIIHNCMAILPGERVMLVTDAGMAHAHKALRAEIEAIGPAELWEFVLEDKQRPLTALPDDWLKGIDTFDVGIEFFTRNMPDEITFRVQRVERLVSDEQRLDKWFDKHKGFGFVNIFSKTEDVFVHMETVRRCGFQDLASGEGMAVRTFRGPRGLMVAELKLWESALTLDDQD